jgi:ATP-dependent helicase YprA (DUF1998 family)
MSSVQSLAPRAPATLETVHNIFSSLVTRFRTDEVLTAVRQIPAREPIFRPMPAWVTPALAGAYWAKGIRELYSHQASTAELVREGKSVVVVTPTASGKTLCYNLPVLNAVLENPDTRALYMFPTKALAQDQLAELQDLAKRLDDNFGVFTYDGDTPSDARKVRCNSFASISFTAAANRESLPPVMKTYAPSFTNSFAVTRPIP